MSEGEPEFFWVFSSDFEEDDDLDMIDDILYEIEGDYDISECNEPQMIRFLRQNNYDIDVFTDALVAGEFGECIPLNPEFDVSYSRGKVSIKKQTVSKNKNPPKTSAKGPKPKPKVNQEPQTYAINVIGPANSGKTSLIDRISNKKLEYQSLIIKKKEVDLIDNVPIVKGKHSYIIVVDVTNIDELNFDNDPLRQLKQYGNQDVIVAINKFDLVSPDQQQLAYENAVSKLQPLFEKYGWKPHGYVPISIKKDLNIVSRSFDFYHSECFLKSLLFMELHPY